MLQNGHEAVQMVSSCESHAQYHVGQWKEAKESGSRDVKEARSSGSARSPASMAEPFNVTGYSARDSRLGDCGVVFCIV